MDDSCAVCAEPLEWVAYGPCGHREVCSTCVARLRFICDDRRCCICKTECKIVFVTKALGDYTRMITNFSVFPSDSSEGQVGTYYYHEDTQAYFDDSDHYKMIRAMCKLSCSVCDKMGDEGKDNSQRKAKFRNIEQLKSHLYHRHRLFMCSLCLEGRKIFICEQKLYTRSQLNQHINTGNSEVDGSESERGGFMGHPICEFCKRPFYGDNELYTHMSTEHFTCHICQRQHPGQYEYYKDYDNLEIHFRREHFLCEDEACLVKKFIVFPTESELKRHNAIEHGGQMSRSKRNAALQIPTSFRYRRSNEQDHRRGRGRGFRSESSDGQISIAIQASLETANVENTSHDPSSNTQVSDRAESTELGTSPDPFESSFPPDTTTHSETSSRYLQALGHSRNAPLQESSFPPLPLGQVINQQNPRHESEGTAKTTMAARLRHRNNGTVNILNSAQAWPAARYASSTSTQFRPPTNGLVLPSPTIPSQSKLVTNGPVPSSYASFTQGIPATVHGLASASSASSSWNSGVAGRVSLSASAPNPVEVGSLDSSLSNFPPVSAAQKHKLQKDSLPLPDVEDVHTANKSLVERIREALEFDESKFTAFKELSAEYRQDVIDADEYLAYAQQFGLSHLVPELARLCPDAGRQKVLLETYNANLWNSTQQKGRDFSSDHSKDIRSRNKGKGKGLGNVNSNSMETLVRSKGKGKCLEDGNTEETLADGIMNTVKKLQLGYKPPEGDVEVLSKDGYRAPGVKPKAFVDDRVRLSATVSELAESPNKTDSHSPGGGLNQNLPTGGGGSKQRKKTSKFQRVRLGDGSVAALLDLKHSGPSLDQVEETGNGNKSSSADNLPVRGVWRNGGGQRLMRQGGK
ncbi:E3 ubiquitin-protein ligase ZNF598-like [Macadamia integrifolia]|uniref:E3 ubiquitin-protein ligase ZNF598-like n=1 Tax=Macadamia integrifolia TaxID=60698 RepID=UPI001C533D8C|nr:E3 ubiquitin-protein ligase ZNF598-like [Macadamia integrifolia]